MGDYPDDFNYHEDITEDDMYELIKTIPLDCKPDKEYSYSNLGYIILGILIRKVTDHFYGDFLHENIFQPLEMKTARIINESDIILNCASGYIINNNQIKNQEWVSPSLNTFAGGALYLNICDMIKWGKALNTKKTINF